MLIPFLLLAIACVSAAVVAYGNNPELGRFGETGVQLIMVCRRIQWPMVTISLVLCLVLIAMVIAGKRRAWWLIGLAPVLALFAHRFSTGPQNYFAVADNPAMLSADEVSFLRGDDWVVGIVIDDQAYAYPYAALYSTPVVVQAERDKRTLLLWSPFANVARAYSVDRDVRARDLDIVSMPANALLVYNTRLGQFINGITGKTSAGSAPTGVHGAIPTTKTTWKHWLANYPQTKVMPTTGRATPSAPAAPVLPAYALPETADATDQVSSSATMRAATTRAMTAKRHPATRSASNLHPTTAPIARIVMIPTTQPIAVLSDQISAVPLNFLADNVPVLLFRDPATQQVRGFDRRIDSDLSPRFVANTDRRRKALGVAFVDADTNTGWSYAGIAIDGPDKKRRGQKLKPITIDEDVYWGVMKFWLPSLKLYTAEP